jgi:hypothetical protein
MEYLENELFSANDKLVSLLKLNDSLLRLLRSVIERREECIYSKVFIILSLLLIYSSLIYAQKSKRKFNN